MIRKKMARDESGFSTAWILGLVLLIFLVGATFYDISMALVDRQKLVTAADRAANAGATAIDEQNLIDNPGEDLRLLAVTSDPDFLSAPDRCLEALESEKNGQANSIDNFVGDCEIDADPQVIIAKVQGEVSFGSVASWLGVQPKTFTVISRARPTCSNASDATSEAC